MDTTQAIAVEATSTLSFDDAIEQAFTLARLRRMNPEDAWVEEQRVVIEQGRIAAFHVNLRVPVTEPH